MDQLAVLQLHGQTLFSHSTQIKEVCQNSQLHVILISPLSGVSASRTISQFWHLLYIRYTLIPSESGENDATDILDSFSFCCTSFNCDMDEVNKLTSCC